MELQLVYFWAGQRVLRHRHGACSDAGRCPALLSAALRGLFLLLISPKIWRNTHGEVRAQLWGSKLCLHSLHTWSDPVK